MCTKCDSYKLKQNVLLFYQSWTKKAGFVIAQQITELKNENFRFRFVITGLSNNKSPPSDTIMLGKIIYYDNTYVLDYI